MGKQTKPKKATNPKKARPKKDKATANGVQMIAPPLTTEVRKLTADRPIDPHDKTVTEILRRHYYGGDRWTIDEIARSTFGGSSVANSRFGGTRRITKENPRYTAWKRYVRLVIQTIPKEALAPSEGAAYLPPNCAPIRRYDPFAECDD